MVYDIADGVLKDLTIGGETETLAHIYGTDALLEVDSRAQEGLAPQAA